MEWSYYYYQEHFERKLRWNLPLRSAKLQTFNDQTCHVYSQLDQWCFGGPCSRLDASDGIDYVGDEWKTRQARGKMRGIEVRLNCSFSSLFPLILWLLALFPFIIESLEQAILMYSSSKAFEYDSWKGHSHLKLVDWARKSKSSRDQAWKQKWEHCLLTSHQVLTAKTNGIPS